MDGVITLKDTLNAMQAGGIFSLQWVTYDGKRKTGGNVRNEDGCKLSAKANRELSEQDANGMKVQSSKLPSHYRNRTRNILLANGDVRKVNIFLIIGFNGKKVALY